MNSAFSNSRRHLAIANTLIGFFISYFCPASFAGTVSAGEPIKASDFIELRVLYNSKAVDCGKTPISPDADGHIAVGSPIRFDHIQEVQRLTRVIYDENRKPIPASVNTGQYIVRDEPISASKFEAIRAAIMGINFCSGSPAASCGTAHDTVRASAPSTPTEKCSVGTAGSISGAGPWDWTCTDAPSRTRADCTARLGSAGVCGSAHGSYPPSMPSTNLCSVGDVNWGGPWGDGTLARPWQWECTGRVGGPVGCSALQGGSCGTAHGTTAEPVTDEEKCAAGTPTAVVADFDGTWDWTCQAVQDAICESGESVTLPYCGDSDCNGTETCATCSGDCGTCTYTGTYPACTSTCGYAGGDVAATACTRDSDGASVAVSLCGTKTCPATGACETYTGTYPACTSTCGYAGGDVAPTACRRDSDGQSVAVSNCSNKTCPATSACSGPYCEFDKIMDPVSCSSTSWKVLSDGRCPVGQTCDVYYGGEGIVCGITPVPTRWKGRCV